METKGKPCATCEFFGQFPTEDIYHQWPKDVLENLETQHKIRMGIYSQKCDPRNQKLVTTTTEQLVFPKQTIYDEKRLRYGALESGIAQEEEELKSLPPLVQEAKLAWQRILNQQQALEKKIRLDRDSMAVLQRELKSLESERKRISTTSRITQGKINQDYCTFLGNLLEAEKQFLRKAPRKVPRRPHPPTPSPEGSESETESESESAPEVETELRPSVPPLPRKTRGRPRLTPYQNVILAGRGAMGA